jgi:hypothetical protein
MMRNIVAVFFCLLTTAAWAADRELALKVGEKRSFSLPGVAQIAVDDAQVVEGRSHDDRLDVEAHRSGSARILVLLKSDQWVTFHVKVVAGDVPEGPIPEALPADGEPVRLRAGERRAFETPGIARMPLSGVGTFEAKVIGKTLELRATAAGRSTLELWLNGGRHVTVPVIVEGGVEVVPTPSRLGMLAGETVDVTVNGEQLVKAPDVESVQVEDDDVAEARIVGDGRVVVRGLNEGDTHVIIRRGGRLFSHPVNVTASGG